MADRTRNMDGRYSRQEWVPRLGVEGQRRLAEASVAVIGAGGVKSPLLFYLAAAGIGRIRIIDHDKVELSNLNRQILYRTADIGEKKAYAAARTLLALNPEISIEAVDTRADENSYTRLLSGFNLVFEGGESAGERRAFNRWAIANDVMYIHASAQYNYAYVFTVIPGVSACFDCVFRDLPDSHRGPVPVLGSATGVAGSVAASEAIGILSGMAPSLADRMFCFDGWTNSSIQLENHRSENCAICNSVNA